MSVRNPMHSKIELQPRRERHLTRWQELQADPELAKLPYKIETDRFGRILMSPPPFFDHARYVAKIIKLLQTLLPTGEAFAETPVLTADGVKVTDVSWFSAEYTRELERQHPAALERAPEICVEVLSPSNTPEEMAEKRALYFETGAQEVWFCGLNGSIAFYTPELSPQSKICPPFRSQI
jgi:Uma2 family endonuclease